MSVCTDQHQLNASTPKMFIAFYSQLYNLHRARWRRQETAARWKELCTYLHSIDAISHIHEKMHLTLDVCVCVCAYVLMCRVWFNNYIYAKDKPSFLHVSHASSASNWSRILLHSKRTKRAEILRSLRDIYIRYFLRGCRTVVHLRHTVCDYKFLVFNGENFEVATGERVA